MERGYTHSSSARDAYEALSHQQDSFTYWSVGATAIGTAWLTSIVSAVVSEYAIERGHAQANADREAEYGTDDGRFWSIAFDEAWERDRFWDWFSWQTERFQEFADHMKDGDRLDLERKLLKEMIVTEQAVKKQGPGAGGRRPLRFWRGEV
jgi:hypothetical protein